MCRCGAAPLCWFHPLVSPVITLGDGIAKGTLELFGVETAGAWLETEEDIIGSRAELRNRLGSVLGEGSLFEERQEEAMNALQIGEQSVRAVMLPAEDIVALSTPVGSAENFRRMEEHPHTRYPLVGEDLTDFVGSLHVPILARRRDDLAKDDLGFEDLTDLLESVVGDIEDPIDQDAL